jgi:hypothetical protein
MLPASYQIPAAAVLLAGGFIACFLGYRLFKVVLGVFGFIIGAVAASSFFGAGNTTPMVIAAVAGGLVGAGILLLAYFVGVALVGAGIGAVGVHMIWSRLGSDPHALVVILAAVAGAATAMALQRYVIIVATAFAGGWTILWGAMNFLEQTADGVRRPPVWMVYPLDLSPGRRWVLAGWAAIGLLGVFVQLRFTGRSKSPPKAKARKPKGVTT